MKFLFVFASLLFAFSPAAEARDDIFRIEIGKSSGGSDRDLRERVWMLERAVDQLQRKVFQLENEGGSRGGHTTCYIKTTFHGTFSATEPTETAAKAKAMERCSEKIKHGFDCDDDRVKCGK